MRSTLLVVDIMRIIVNTTATNINDSSSDLSPTRGSGCSTPSTPVTDRESRQLRIQTSIQHLECERETRLHANKLVGKTTESSSAAVNYHISLRRVNFKWQRGIKIGNSAHRTHKPQ